MTRHDRLTDRQLRRLAQPEPATDVAKMIGCGVVLFSMLVTAIVMAAGVVVVIDWLF